MGRFTNEDHPHWMPASALVLSILAVVQPSPLALGSVGLAAGITLEKSRSAASKPHPPFQGHEVTLKGKITQKKASFYGQSSIRIKVSEVLGSERLPVDFKLNLNVPLSDDLAKGTQIIVRSILPKGNSGSHPAVMRGRTVGDGWVYIPISPSFIVHGRERLVNALGHFPGSPGTTLFNAIALGERWQVATRTRDVLRKTGTYHLMAISGVHVGAAILPLVILVRFFASLSQKARPRTIRIQFLGLSAMAIFVYLGFSGLSSSALRASVYFVLMCSSFAVGRSPQVMVNLSWCVIIITCFGTGLQPDLSLLLSALAVAGILVSGAGTDSFIKGMVRMTMGATLFTLPVVVWLARGISIIAPAANMAAGVSFGLFLIPAAVLMDFAGLIHQFPLEGMLSLWIRGADITIAVMAFLADLDFSFQKLSVAGCLTASTAAIAGVLFWHRKKYHLGVGLAVFFSVIVLSEYGHYTGKQFDPDDLLITFPEVGQADAAIIRHHGRTVLIDCGPPGLAGSDSPAMRALQRLGVRTLDALFLSHLHPDHAGGLNDIIATLPVKAIYLPEIHYETDPGGRGRVESMVPSTMPVFYLKTGDVVNVSTMVYTVLGPYSENVRPVDINRGSMQLLLEVESKKALFTGDAGWDQVVDTMATIRGLDILKIPHHGSKKDFPPPGMDEIVERAGRTDEFTAVCPSDPPGSRHLPAPEVAQWFKERGIKLVYTGNNGVNIRCQERGSKNIGCSVVDNLFRF